MRLPRAGKRARRRRANVSACDGNCTNGRQDVHPHTSGDQRADDARVELQQRLVFDEALCAARRPPSVFGAAGQKVELLRVVVEAPVDQGPRREWHDTRYGVARVGIEVAECERPAPHLPQQ